MINILPMKFFFFLFFKMSKLVMSNAVSAIIETNSLHNELIVKKSRGRPKHSGIVKSDKV